MPKSATARRRKQKAALRKRPRSECYVYAVIGEDGRTRYVGQTRLTLKARFKYLREAASPTGSPIQRWMHANKAQIKMLDAKGVWDVTEVVWIERLRAAGEPLLNCNMGGRDTGRGVAPAIDNLTVADAVTPAMRRAGAAALASADISQSQEEIATLVFQAMIGGAR